MPVPYKLYVYMYKRWLHHNIMAFHSLFRLKIDFDKFFKTVEFIVPITNFPSISRVQNFFLLNQKIFSFN